MFLNIEKVLVKISEEQPWCSALLWLECYFSQSYHMLFHLAPPRWLSSWTFSLGSFVGESNSLFPTNITIFVIGQQRTWLPPDTFLSTAWSATVHTAFFSSVLIVTILAISHWFCWHSSNSTISSTVKFGVCFCHFCLGCRLWRNYFLHLVQNSFAMRWTCHHHFFGIQI